jgi:hypothetical protein
MSSKLEILEGYLAVPHQLLHIAGYRLVGKQCVYRLGKPYVLPVGTMTRRERLIGILFPFITFCTIFLVSSLGASLALTFFEPTTIPWWGFAFFLLAVISGLYTFFSTGDLRQAYQLLHNKTLRSRTPFDFLWSWQEGLQKADPQLVLALLALSALTLTLIYIFSQD